MSFFFLCFNFWPTYFDARSQTMRVTHLESRRTAMKRMLQIGIAVITLAGLWPASSSGTQVQNEAAVDGHDSKTSSKQLAIVIDDFGNQMTGTSEMMQLPIHFTAAVMPFMPTTKRDAELAHKLGHEVIVHMPMEPNRGKPEWLGPGAIMTNLSDEEIRKRVEDAIHDVPFAIGMNNHMGSKVTADERVMRIVLSVVRKHGMFFLDSRTTFKTVIPKLSAELGVPLLSNEVFLDDVYTMDHIGKQMGVVKKYLDSHFSSTWLTLRSVRYFACL